MKSGLARILAGALVAATFAGCGESHAPRHAAATSAAAAEPTPDTTPVEPLRTPAGLALKPEAALPPAAARTPSAAPAAKATP